MKDKIYAIDWATKKNFAVFDGKKTKSIANTIKEFDKFLDKIGGSAAGRLTKSSINSMPSPILLFEEGGADMQKLKAFRAGYEVLTIPGKKIRDYRESIGEEKTDEKDAELIYRFY